jgi:signal recognition particle subunit SRP54
MVLDKLGSSLRDTLSKITKSFFVDDTLINELVKDLQRALLQSDVNVKLVFSLTQQIKLRAKEDPLPGITKREQLVNIVYEELTNFLGKQAQEISITKQPTKILLVGLFGAGKTTTAGKLARYYKKRGLKVAVMQTDTWRPAAFEQLKQLASDVGVEFFGKLGEKDPVSIYLEFEEKLSAFDVVIVDSAGRDALSEELVTELNNLNGAVEADERLLVVAADIGQAAQKQAQMFHESCKVTGVIVTKLEGTAKGGGALSACAVTGAPIKFIGVGEKLDDLETFDPQGFVGQLLGMGDLKALLEKAQTAFNVEDAQDMTKRFMEGKFTLNDLYDQMSSMKKMGSFKKIMGLIPGMSSLKLPKEMLDVQEEKLDRWKFAMDSMTPEEKENPMVINAQRIDRIAAGSGTSIREIRDLLKQFKMGKKMTKMFKGEQDVNKMMSKLKGKMPKGFGM